MYDGFSSRLSKVFLILTYFKQFTEIVQIIIKTRDQLQYLDCYVVNDTYIYIVNDTIYYL